MDQIPGHVRPSDVVDFDYFDCNGPSGDPYITIADALRGRTPRIFYTPRHGGHWVIGGHDELFDAYRRPETFSSSSMQIPEMADEPKFLPLNSDPPEHSHYRSVLNRAFSPSQAAKMGSDIRGLAAELIQAIAADGEADFVAKVAEPLPVFIIMKMIGIPFDKFRLFRDNVHTFLTDPVGRSASLQFFLGEIGKLIADKAAHPGDDLMTQLIASEIDGRPITDAEVSGLCQMVIFAGLDTVTNGMSLAMRHLALDQALQARLRDDPSQITAAVEELLRRYAFANQGRLLLRDVEFYGKSMKQGERVLLLPPGAALDQSAFADPEEVRLDRKGKGIPTFGFGPHRCVGMHLARMELQILLQEWLQRIPTFSLAADDPPVFHGGVVFGLKRMGLTWSRQDAHRARPARRTAPAD